MVSSPVRWTCGQHIVPNLECKENSCFRPNGSRVSGRRDIRNLRARPQRGFRYTTYSARHKAGDPSPRGRFPGPWEPLERLWGSKAVLPAPTSAFMPIPSAVPPGADGRDGTAVSLFLTHSGSRGSPIRDTRYRRLQPFRHPHDCSGCFRLERWPSGACTHWKSAALPRRTPKADIITSAERAQLEERI
jgi:hypothetical protein